MYEYVCSVIGCNKVIFVPSNKHTRLCDNLTFSPRKICVLLKEKVSKSGVDSQHEKVDVKSLLSILKVIH
jgi:hypothetical protein